jgi:hypothetical protein
MKTTLFEATLPVARCVISIISILAFTPSARGAGPDFTVAGQTLSAQQWHYYQVHLDPEHNYNGWRLSLSVTAGDGSPTMHVRKGGGASDPVTSDNSTKSGTHTVIFTEPEFTFETYYVGVYLPSGSITYTLTGRTPYFEVLEWDDGETENGVEFQAPAERSGGDHFLRIQAEASAAGAWRTVLRVLEGEADLFLSRIESPYETVESSQRTGSDGIVLHSSQYNPGGTWLIRVHASPGADWRVVSGEIHVKDLGELGCDGAGGAEKIGPEGFRFYKTTIKPQNDGCPPNVAWGLWLNGATNRILVSKSAAPLPDHSDLDQKGQMLVVPGYLATSTFDGSYFVAVVGDPDTDIVLTSKAQEISDLDFGSSTSPVVVDGFGYRTYRVQVPVEQIAWHIEAAPLEGDPNIAVRRELVPNERNNDAYSEAVGAADSIALAPPTLSDGVFYITVYGKGPFSYVLKNGSPEITDISFESQSGIANCVLQPPGCSHAGRVGWRYYRVHDIGGQLGHLGWELLLENYAPGTEIALRRNAAPARWQYRYDQWSQTPNPGAHVDLASSFGFLQHPAHQSDIWYVGVYNPAAPLGDFTLKTLPITARDIDINDTVAMPAVPEGKWSFFRLLVSESVLGLDVRVIQVAGGNPMVVMRRDQLPNSLQTLWPRTLSGTDPWNSQSWPSGAQWAGTSDWASSYETPDVPADFHMLQMGTGNPLERGAYYIGVFNNSASRSSYTLRTRGIGTGGTIPVRDLGFAPGGPVANVASGIVAPREADYWRVDVPPGKKSWKVRLTINGAGDALLLSQKEALPNIMAGRQDPAYPGSALHMAGGIRMYQSGNEHFLLLPNAGSSTIDIGNYYLVVANSEKGDGPLSSYTLESMGELAVTDLGVLRSDGCAASAPEQELQAGEVFAYSFSALPDTSMIEARVLNAEGSPRIALRPGVQLPSAQQRDFDAYGTQGGENEYDPPYTLTGSNLISLANPSPGDHMLLVKANDGQPLKSFSVEVCSVRPMELKFDGGVTNVTHHPARSWKVFSVPVPEAAGWDIRIEDVVSGYPRLVVRRDALPMDVEDRWLGTDSGERPWEAQEWPSQSQWAGVVDWTWRYSDAAGNDAHSSMLQMGMGNPLEQGLYYVGVYNYGEEPASYKVVSRGIGMGRLAPVTLLGFSGGRVEKKALRARYADYYEVTVPSNVSSWKVRLAHASEGGETLLLCQKGALPNVMAGRQWSGSSGSALGLSGGIRMQKTGNEHYLLLPEAGRSVIPGGKYYLAVVSEGVNPWDDRIGFGSSSYVLESLGELRPWDLGELRSGGSIIAAGETLEGGEIQVYQFTMSEGALVFEARLESRVGNPQMGLAAGTGIPHAGAYPGSIFDPYGCDQGQPYAEPYSSWQSATVLTVGATPGGQQYTLVVKADATSDASYTLRISTLDIPALAFAGQSAGAYGILADKQRAFYRVTVPQSWNNAPVLGWRLGLTQTSGAASLRVRKGGLPSDLAAGTAPFTKDTAILAPPFLTPGDWYVEVISEGLTSYGLTSGAVTLERTPWAMPAAGQHVTTPGLGGSEYFADTGFDENGNPICDMPCDQGVDLERGGFHFYAVEITNANGALLRIQLEAISGNPDLYARAGMIPTLMHAEDGHEGALYDRCLAKWSQTEYGNWVPVSGRQQTELDPGMLYLAVRAAGDSNVRYRLRLEADCASSDRIQDLDLDGGAKENQTIAAGDWRFYRVRIPLQAPKNWSVTFNQLVGDVVLHMRDTIPPGQAPNPPRSDGYDSVKDWADDNKNSGPYPTSDPYGLGVTAMDAPGAYVFSVPHIRPGSIYYLGFQAKSDATFNVSSSISEETIGDVPIMHFVTGAIASKSILPGGKLRYRIDTPADGVHLKFEFRASSERVTAYLQQGTLPAENATDHWLSTQSSQVIFEASLLEQTWPWLPGMSYYLTIANNSDVPAAADFTMLTDNDQDGLPDFWEIAMFGDTASYSAHDDPDGDGLTNLQELLLGTNPLDARTPGVFAPPTPLSDGTIALALSGEPGKQYRIEASENAGRTWSDIGTVAAGPSGNIHIDDRDAVQHAYRIYRTVLMK